MSYELVLRRGRNKAVGGPVRTLQKLGQNDLQNKTLIMGG